MTFIKTRIFLPGLLLLTTASFAQQNPPKSQAPAKSAPAKKDSAPTQQAPADKSKTPDQPKADKKPDQAAAYYHFSLAHMYEEMMAMYGRSEFATKAIEEYRLAIENAPSPEYLNASLAELYAKTGRIRDAVLEARTLLSAILTTWKPTNFWDEFIYGPWATCSPEHNHVKCLALPLSNMKPSPRLSPRMRTITSCWAGFIF